jgi:DNA-directed RNA polymerase specialized sigma subunit
VGTFLEKECDERDRKLYDLRYRDERSQEDAAKAAGLTRIQVRRWETKFRTRMLKYLKRVRYV